MATRVRGTHTARGECPPDRLDQFVQVTDAAVGGAPRAGSGVVSREYPKNDSPAAYCESRVVFGLADTPALARGAVDTDAPTTGSLLLLTSSFTPVRTTYSKYSLVNKAQNEIEHETNSTLKKS